MSETENCRRFRGRVIVTLGVLVASVCTPAKLRAQPVLNGPALAITQPSAMCPVGDSSLPCTPLAITGSGFGTPGREAVVTVKSRTTTGHARFRLIRSTADRVMLWTDRLILLALTDLDSIPVAVRVKTPGYFKVRANARAYAYDSYDTHSKALPLAIEVDAAGRVFLNEEYHRDVTMWLPESDDAMGLNALPAPPPGVFAQNLYNDSPSEMSILGEDVVLGAAGTVWFTEGGADNYGGPYANHSRLIAHDPATQRVAMYTVPGDNNQVYGAAWDAGLGRLWFVSSGVGYDCIPWFGCKMALPPRLVSFDPTRIAPDDTFNGDITGLTCNGGSATTVGTCSNVPARPCTTARDCVQAEQWCPPGTADDSACYREYPIAGTQKAGHLVVDGVGAVWYTAYAGGNHLGRLDPTTGAMKVFPLPPARQGSVFGSAVWEIAIKHNGNIVFSEFADAEVGEFDIAQVDNPACLELDANHQNPCIRTFSLTDAEPGGRVVHSLAVDAMDNTWFTHGGGGAPADPLRAPEIGYATASGKGLVMLPPLSLYPFRSDGGTNYCGVTTADTYVRSSPAGIAIHADTGDIWFADFCRHQVGRLRSLPDPLPPLERLPTPAPTPAAPARESIL
jgi:streptogramin lyase